MNLRRGDEDTWSIGLCAALEFLVAIPELFLPVMAACLVVAMAIAPFYVVYATVRAVSAATPGVAPTALPGADIARIQDEVGIEWIHAPAPPATSASCPYCGGAVEGRVTECPCCDVPHHSACWEENRGCTVYACGGRWASGQRRTGRQLQRTA